MPKMFDEVNVKIDNNAVSGDGDVIVHHRKDEGADWWSVPVLSHDKKDSYNHLDESAVLDYVVTHHILSLASMCNCAICSRRVNSLSKIIAECSDLPLSDILFVQRALGLWVADLMCLN